VLEIAFNLAHLKAWPLGYERGVGSGGAIQMQQIASAKSLLADFFSECLCREPGPRSSEAKSFFKGYEKQLADSNLT